MSFTKGLLILEQEHRVIKSSCETHIKRVQWTHEWEKLEKVIDLILGRYDPGVLHRTYSLFFTHYGQQLLEREESI